MELLQRSCIERICAEMFEDNIYFLPHKYSNNNTEWA